MLALWRFLLFVLIAAWPMSPEAAYRERLEEAGSFGQASPSAIVERELAPKTKGIEDLLVSVQGHLALGEVLRLVLPKDWRFEVHQKLLACRVNLSHCKRPLGQVLKDLGERLGFVWQVDSVHKVLRLREISANKEAKRSGNDLSFKGSAQTQAKPLPGKDSSSTGQKAPQPNAEPDYTVEKPGLACEIARRLGLSVRDLCAWNHIGPHTPLGKGYRLYRHQPPKDAQIMANLASEPANFGKKGRPDCDRGKILPGKQPENSAQRPERARATNESPGQTGKSRESLENGQAKEGALDHKVEALPASKAEAKQAESTKPAPFTYRLMPGPLSAQLAQWCRQGLAELVWRADCELELAQRVDFGCVFEEAVRALFRSLAAQGQPLRATFYRGNRVLEVRGQ
ncbi:MAG: TcpQ domain-containing protein [Desulfovibrio sp.]|nr:TcpQ domain-containing protein [Desulfovibrio sp.]